MKTILVLLALSSLAAADTVKLKNGDTLTGTIGTVTSESMEFKSPVFGAVTIPMTEVESFVAEGDSSLRTKDDPREPLTGPLSGTGDTLQVGPTTVPIEDVKAANAPPAKWTGSIAASVAVTRGNTDTVLAGVDATAQLRRETPEHNDRFTLAAQYRFSNTGTGDATLTTADNYAASGKYDIFFENKYYAFAVGKIERDRIADLDYRLSPGVGVGKQWFEGPNLNFNTDLGLSYVFEKYPDDTNEFVALRFAYHLDKKLRENVTLIHNLEYLPAITDPADYVLNTDVGLRVNMTKTFFTETKFELRRDSSPAPGAQENDFRYLVGVGWTF